MTKHLKKQSHEELMGTPPAHSSRNSLLLCCCKNGPFCGYSICTPRLANHACHGSSDRREWMLPLTSWVDNATRDQSGAQGRKWMESCQGQHTNLEAPIILDKSRPVAGGTMRSGPVSREVQREPRRNHPLPDFHTTHRTGSSF